MKEVAIREDRIWLAEALIDEVHDNRQVVLVFVLQHSSRGSTGSEQTSNGVTGGKGQWGEICVYWQLETSQALVGRLDLQTVRC